MFSAESLGEEGWKKKLFCIFVFDVFVMFGDLFSKVPYVFVTCLKLFCFLALMFELWFLRRSERPRWLYVLFLVEFELETWMLPYV